MSEYTKGPWKLWIGQVAFDHRYNNWTIEGERGGKTLRIAEKWRGDDEDIANARLIAAAPDLYEALKAVQGNPYLFDHVKQLIDAAIAKAEATHDH